MKDILKGAVFFGLFLIPLLTLYVANDMFFPYITGKNFVFRIIVEVVTAAWILLALYDVEYRPRFSWILATFVGFMAVMLVANLRAVHFVTAFWSNFERMDGYITLIHVFLYFIVLGSVLRTQKAWTYFFHTSVVVAGFVALNGLSQLSAANVRVDSTLGNAAYMAVYMLFHIFILLYLSLQTKVTPYRIVYGLLGLLFVYVLLQTGTRGTALGLVAGLLTTVVYTALFATRFKQVQKYAFGSLVLLLLLIAGFLAARDSSFIQHNGALARIANISVSHDLVTRGEIWGEAIKGIKERPLLGWGQGNFNYVFNKYYDPRLYGQEQWFDRTHDIFFDWLIAGGILGLLTYLSIFAAIAYYLVVRPLRQADDAFTVMERGVLLGLMVGYMVHNMVVFDNIVSYIFFGTIIALIHSRVSRTMPKVAAFRLPAAVITQVVTPVVIVLAGLCVYFVNVPSIQAAQDIIVAFGDSNPASRLNDFETALNRGSFARQEIVEQFAQQAMSVAAASKDQVPEAVRAAYLKRAEEEMLKMVAEKPGDARLEVFLASFYRSTGDLKKAEEHMAIARTLSPGKQAIILQQGAIALSLGKNTIARDFFKQAFELDTTNDEAREYYVAALFYNKQADDAKKLIADSTPEFRDRIAKSDFVVSAVNAAGEFSTLASLYEVRVADDKTNAQNWASLAFVYYQLKQMDKAIETLQHAAAAVTAFAPTADCITKNIKAGKEPQAGCQAPAAAQQ
jgi:O-antigen ligase/tetratricopeptide (TPR) repeat protein